MAEVFEGELTGDLGFTRRIAIKRVLADAAADPLAAQRFLDEARIASRLHHANIVAVLDVGLLEGLPFQVLELVDGINVQQLMQRAGNTLPVDIALIVAGEVAHALDHAHTACDATGASLGIVHRDVKPSNVLLSWAGDVKLSDFGIALARDRSSKTEAGTVAGTLGFMAPEQRLQARLDGRTDVYALGLTLHAMLVGYSPLQDITVEVAAMDGQRPPLAPSIPDDVALVIASALDPDRLARPTAKQLAAALSGVASPRITRDRRTILQEFLASLGGGPARRGGALDHLLGVELVLSPDSGDDLARYEMQRVRAEAPTVHEMQRVRAEAPTVHGMPRERAADTERDGDRAGAGASLATTALREVAPRGGRRARVALVAAAVIAIGSAAIWKATASAPLPAHEPALASPIDIAATPILAPADAAVAAVPATPVDAAPPTVVAAVAPPPDTHAVTTRALTAHAHRDPAPAAGSAVPAPVAAPAADTGYLQVAGEGLIGAKVLVDGAVRGYPPAKIELTRGHHTIVVEKPDGTRLPTRDVDVTDLNTFANPVRPTW